LKMEKDGDLCDDGVEETVATRQSILRHAS
jgi:hypothetical protein